MVSAGRRQPAGVTRAIPPRPGSLISSRWRARWPWCRSASVTAPNTRSTTWVPGVEEETSAAARLDAVRRSRPVARRVRSRPGSRRPSFWVNVVALPHDVVLVQPDQRHLALLGAVERRQQAGSPFWHGSHHDAKEVDDQRLAAVPAEGKPADRSGRRDGRLNAAASTTAGWPVPAGTGPDQPDRGQRPGHAERDEDREDLVPPRPNARPRANAPVHVCGSVARLVSSVAVHVRPRR